MGQLAQVLREVNVGADERLLVGPQTFDDAGVVLVDGGRTGLVQTVDYFPPIVDDPYIYGQIAATNSLSDIYAMGGKPVTAMNVVGMPAMPPKARRCSPVALPTG